MIGSSRKRETQNELTHTQRRVITSEINGKRDRSGVKGQDYFYCNKHISTLCNSEAGAGHSLCFYDVSMIILRRFLPLLTEYII